MSSFDKLRVQGPPLLDLPSATILQILLSEIFWQQALLLAEDVKSLLARSSPAIHRLLFKETLIMHRKGRAVHELNTKPPPR